MTSLIGNDVASMVEFARKRGNYPRFVRQNSLFKAGDVSGLGDAINVTYGAIVYDQVNREANAHAIIKKENWERSGFRVTTSNPTDKGWGGADPGTVGTIVDVAPVELDSLPGFLHTPFDLTMDAGFRAQHDDGLDVWEWKVAMMRDIHAQLLNEEILRDAEAEAVTGGAVTDPKSNGGGKGVESLDRLVSADNEEDSVGGSGSGWYDLYEGQIDRDSATTFDSYVIRPDGTQATYGTDLPFQIAALDKVIDETENNGADPASQVFLTKRDSRRAFYDEVNTFGRYDLTQVQTKLDMGGLSTTATHPGRDISFTVRAYQDRPIVVDKNVPADGKGRWFLLDQRHVHIKVGFPTIYVDVDNPVIRGKFDTKALYLSCEQVYMTRFNTSAKIRSIA
jgi:hypothetical protein